MPDTIVGIDLGTTNSLIGVMDAGFPILLADENGERLTPSVVHIGANGESSVGRPATRMRILDPKSTIYSAKRLIGLPSNEAGDVDPFRPGSGQRLTYQIVRRKGRTVSIRVGDEEYKPEEISALVLKKLKADAERSLGREVSRAVITVPA